MTQDLGSTAFKLLPDCLFACAYRFLYTRVHGVSSARYSFAIFCLEYTCVNATESPSLYWST